MKHLFIAFLVLMVGMLKAQTMESVSTTDSLSETEASPWGFKFISDTYSGLHSGDDLLSKNRLYFDYHLTENDSLTSESRIYHMVNPARDLKGTYLHRTTLRYRRSNLLTSEDNGVNLGAYLGRRQYVDGGVKNRLNVNGHLEFGFDMTKRVGNWTFVVNPEYNVMDNSVAPTATTDQYYLFAMGTYALNNKWGLSLWGEGIYSNKVQPGAVVPGLVDADGSRSLNVVTNDTIILIVPQIDYTITPGTMASLYVATLPFQNRDDGQFIRENWLDDTSVGIYFQSRVF